MPEFTISNVNSNQQTLLNDETGVVTATGALLTAGRAISLSGNTETIIFGQVTARGTGSTIETDPSLTPSFSTEIVIGSSGSLVATGGSAIDVESSETYIWNAGQVFSRLPAILIGPNSVGFSTTFQLQNSGSIQSSNSAAVGVFVGAGVSYIDNTGMLLSSSSVPGALSFNGTTGIVYLNNSGLIQNNVSNIAIEVVNVQIDLSNSGQINGDVRLADASDTISNTGRIDGDIIAGNGNDVIDLIGGEVTGIVRGGLGSDTYLVDSTAIRIREAAGEGDDSVGSMVSWTLTNGFERLELLGDAAITGNGNAAANVILGNEADNVLRGRAGDDTLFGLDGDDTLIGGAGNDTYRIDLGDIIVEAANGGTDTVQILGQFGASRYTLGPNVENLEFGPPSSVSVTGNALDNRIVTGIGNDTLNGTTGTDRLEGGFGNDTYITDGGDFLADFGGIDTVRSSVSFALSSAFENLTLTGSAVFGTGNLFANIIIGNAVANTLNGQVGNDTLTGGAGNDNFVFTTTLGPTNIDRVTDYNVAADTIRIDNAVFTGLALGALSAAAFVRNSTGLAADASDRIIYETDTGALRFDRDGAGGQPGVQFATLNPGLLVTAADVFVF